jgi:hypothetical protein
MQPLLWTAVQLECIGTECVIVLDGMLAKLFMRPVGRGVDGIDAMA